MSEVGGTPEIKRSVGIDGSRAQVGFQSMPVLRANFRNTRDDAVQKMIQFSHLQEAY